jgi:predicted amidohydrolase YtcJ
MEKFNTTYTMIKGKVYTANKTNDFVEGVLIHDQKFELCGTIDEVNNHISLNNISKDQINTIELPQGQLVLPGFIDSHVHTLACIETIGIDLNGIYDLQVGIKVIKDYIENNPNLSFYYGWGYNDLMFGTAKAHASILDEICREKPIAIMRYEGHAYWTNSKCIELAGVSKDTIYTDGGRIELDEDGELTGIFHDDAMRLIKNHIPALSTEQKIQALEKTLKSLLPLGIVSYMDAAVSFDHIDLFRAIYSKKEIVGQIPRGAVSVVFSSFLKPNQEKSAKNNLENASEFVNSERRIIKWDDFETPNKLKVNTVKLFIDGVFESGTALFSNCDCQKHGYSFTTEELTAIAEFLYSHVIQIHCHCIGDLAITNVLDAIEMAKNKYQDIPNNARNYIAHLQLVNDKDFSRLKDLNVYSSFSPYWFQKDSYSDKLEAFIGSERVKYVYPIKSIIDHGGRVAFGSDWPVTTLNPLEGIEVAVTHKALGCRDREPYVPEQKIELLQAVRAYTIDSAEVLGLENVIGSIEKGKLADLIVLDKDIFEIEEYEIHTTKAVKTLIDGKLVYSS